jgi:CBS domain containing-hemolysin-like protein
MLAASHAEGVLDPARHDLMVQALDFRDREVGTLMVPWDQVVKIEKSTTVAGTERTVRESGHSRVPVLNSGPEDVLGFVHAKDLLRISPEDRSKPVPDELIRPMLVLRQTAKLNQALIRMRHTRTHFAVVTDGLRRPVGIVTLEDVLESLVGPIVDEHDVRGPRRRARALVRRRKS